MITNNFLKWVRGEISSKDYVYNAVILDRLNRMMRYFEAEIIK